MSDIRWKRSCGGGRATTNIFKQWSQVSEIWINGRTLEPREMYNELNQGLELTK